jgi:hypothetical protein
MCPYQETQHIHPRFPYDTNATVDMPMRLVITVIIGTITLISIFGFLSQSLVIPSYLQVSIEPMFYQWNESVNTTEFTITVKDSSDHQPVDQALVVLKGPFNIQYNYTNHSGICNIQVESMKLPGIHEWFLDVTVKAARYECYKQEQMIRILNGSRND